MSIIEKRYAEALVNLSDEENTVEAYRQELETIGDIFENHEEFKSFILNQTLPANVKKDLIRDLFSGKARAGILNFLFLLVDKGRIGNLPDIIKEFNALADKRKNILNIKIISAVPVEDSLIEKIKDRYGKIHNAAGVKAEVEIDRNVIGGIKILIGDTVTDATLKGRLKQLEELIARG